MKQATVTLIKIIVCCLFSLQLQAQSPGEGTFDRSLQLVFKNSSGGIFAVLQFDGNNAPGGVNVCKGEEITIEIYDSFPSVCQGCPEALFYNELSYCDRECISVTPPDAEIQYQGGVFDYTTNINYSSQVYSSCYTSSEVIVRLTPIVTDTFSISWQTVRQVIYEEGRVCNPAGYPFNQTVNYSNRIMLNVLPDVQPELSAPIEVSPGEFFPISFLDCSPNLSYKLLEECTNWDDTSYDQNTFSNCQFNDGPIQFGYVAPPYTTTLKFRVIYGYPSPCEGEFEFTNEVLVNVVESPVENACDNNPNIASTETMLQDEILVANRTNRDYHYYETSTSICNLSNDCDVALVWGKMKSDIAFQVPLQKDFDPIIPTIWETTPGSGSITNCSNAFIASTFMRSRLNIGLSGLLSQFIFDTEIQDPVKIVIDEECKCITNYTLPGHILHPGKVRRCIKLDACNEVTVETLGTGFTTAGPSLFGDFLARENEIIGLEAFKNVSKRLKEQF